jgi:hypothetical protein
MDRGKDLRRRIGLVDVQLDTEREYLRTFRAMGAPEPELDAHRRELDRLLDLRAQLSGWLELVGMA